MYKKARHGLHGCEAGSTVPLHLATEPEAGRIIRVSIKKEFIKNLSLVSNTAKLASYDPPP